MGNIPNDVKYRIDERFQNFTIRVFELYKCVNLRNL